MFSAKQDHPTRREFLAGLAAVSAASGFPAALSAQDSAPSLCFTLAVDMAAMIRAKKLSAREALEEHLKQIDRVNPRVNAIVTLIADQATAAATNTKHPQPVRCHVIARRANQGRDGMSPVVASMSCSPEPTALHIAPAAPL